jgi:imidazolonepropionase
VDSLDGALVTPGLIDCHTHLVFGGDRAQEFDLRLNGASYEEIARAGGGIMSSVTATCGEEEAIRAVAAACTCPARRWRDHVGNQIRLRTGAGMGAPHVARRTTPGRELGIHVRTSFLGLHALPPEYKDRRDDYVTLVCDEMLPTLAAEGLVDAVDAFCEGIGFTPRKPVACSNAPNSSACR